MNIYAVISIVEGFLIVCMLGWEIFWLRRMFKVLYAMPTASQVTQMVEILQKDGQAIRTIAGLVVPNLFNKVAKNEEAVDRK